MPRRGLHAVPAVAEVDLIDVRLEDLLLAVVALHLPRRLLLAELARDAQIPAVDLVGVHVPDELLRDRARTAAMPARDPVEQLALDGAGDADQIHAVVLIEALILYGDERLSDVLGQRADRDARPGFPSHLADERAIAGVDERRLRLGDDLPGLARPARGRGGGRLYGGRLRGDRLRGYRRGRREERDRQQK